MFSSLADVPDRTAFALHLLCFNTLYNNKTTPCLNIVYYAQLPSTLFH